MKSILHHLNHFLYKHFGIAITIYKNYGLYGNKVIKPKEGNMYFVWTIGKLVIELIMRMENFTQLMMAA